MRLNQSAENESSLVRSAGWSFHSRDSTAGRTPEQRMLRWRMEPKDNYLALFWISNCYMVCIGHCMTMQST